jgi:hypothetical protein
LIEGSFIITGLPFPENGRNTLQMPLNGLQHPFTSTGHFAAAAVS